MFKLIRNLPIRLLLYLLPGGIRIIDGHRLCKLCCIGTEILLIDHARFAYNESLQARGAVLHGVGDKGKSCGHLSVGDVVLRSTRCMGSLAFEDPEKITIERTMRSHL